jgi:hypothetical protein
MPITAMGIFIPRLSLSESLLLFPMPDPNLTIRPYVSDKSSNK